MQSRSLPVVDPKVGADRYVGVDVYQATKPGDIRPVQGTISTSTELLFAYRNIGPNPFDYLMIFGVDQSGEVFWYYPAHLDSSANPPSIATAGRGGWQGATQSDWARTSPRRPRNLCGIFTHAPLRVKQVETLIQRHRVAGRKQGLRLSIDDSGQHIIALEVLP